MEQLSKRIKTTKESTVADIASSIEHISECMKSIGEIYGTILRVNKAIVNHLQDIQQCKGQINLEESEVNSDRVLIEKT